MLIDRELPTAAQSSAQKHFRSKAEFRRSIGTTVIVVSTRFSFPRCYGLVSIAIGKFASRVIPILELLRLSRQRQLGLVSIAIGKFASRVIPILELLRLSRQRQPAKPPGL